MRPESRHRWFWGMVSVALAVLGLFGVPSDVQQCLTYLDKLLKLLNHEGMRWLFVVACVLAAAMIFYPRDMRRFIRSRFRLGDRVAIAHFILPLEQHGWTAAKSAYACTLESPPGRSVLVRIEPKSGTTLLRYEFPNPDPTARYVHVRADRIEIATTGDFLNKRHFGVDVSVEFIVRRKSDNRECVVTVRHEPDVPTCRVASGHDWFLNSPVYRDLTGMMNVLLDLNVLKAREYGDRHYTFLGVSAIELTVGRVLLDSVRVCQTSKWHHWGSTALRTTTWFPWLE